MAKHEPVSRPFLKFGWVCTFFNLNVVNVIKNYDRYIANKMFKSQTICMKTKFKFTH